MESILVKIFATALTLSQVTTAPEAIKTQFDRTADQTAVAELLHAGCSHMRKAFDIENIDLDGLITTAMDDPQAMTADVKVLRGINFGDLLTAYRQFCKKEKVDKPAVDLAEVIDYYNKALANLPDQNKLKGMKLPGASIVLDGKGQRFAEVFEENQRRVWIPLADIPEHVQSAFIAAEDKRFYEHKGIDERALIRAFIGNLAQTGRPQGGSTITQQIVKNLLVGDDLSYERKMREMIVATRLEQTLSKGEILELYLNSVYLGRRSWGIELAAKGYFGKTAKELTLAEGVLLAGLTKGPNYLNPDRHPGRARERMAYVFSRMLENGKITPEQAGQGLPALPALVAFEHQRRDIGYHFIDQVAREAKALAGIEQITANSYTVRSTINPQLQRVVEATLQEGLARYERGSGRAIFRGAEANLAAVIRKIEDDDKTTSQKPAWQRGLQNARLPLYDVHWTPAVVLEKPSGKKGEAWRVGLADGRILPFSVNNGLAQRKLVLHDVVYVHVSEAGKRKGARAELRVRPQVQGAVVVLENKTGRVLAMAGGFSYPLSQLNRVSQAQRQPGSAIKPLSYLAALHNHLQPNTLVSDEPITLPPIGGGRAREQDYWSPQNYGGGYGGILTLRQALEHSRNLATVHLLDGGIDNDPESSLDRLCRLALDAGIYRECVRYYPFVLGAQPVRPIDLAAFYAAIANEGVRPSPHVIERIERNGLVVYRHDPKSSMRIRAADGVSFYQLKTMLQGVLQRGTARSIASLAPFVAGKTGTSDEENDAWFVGFTNEATVAVWVGYDNAARGRRRTLGGGATGGNVAVPIFAPIIQAVWASAAPKTALAPPTPDTRRQLSCHAIDPESGEPTGARSRRGSAECLRTDRSGRIIDARYQLISQGQTGRDPDGYYRVAPNPFPFFFQRSQPQFGYPGQPQPGYRQAPPESYSRQPPPQQTPPDDTQRDRAYVYDNNGRIIVVPHDSRPDPRGQVQQRPRDPYGRQGHSPQRIDPGNSWGGRRYD
jgi:1A family penicillin-binding protein